MTTTSHRSGLGLALLSAAAFGTSGTCASALIDAGWSPAAAVTARIAVAAVILTWPALAALRGRWSLLRRSAGQVLAYGAVGVVACQLCYFNALRHMPVGVALLLEYLGAVLVVGWLWLRYGQRPRRLTVTGTVAALAGLALVLNLTGSGGGLSLIGVAWGLAAAVALAIYFMLSAADHREPLPPVVMVWGGACTGAVLLALLGLVHAVPMTASVRDVHLLGHQVSWTVPVGGLSLLATAVAYVSGVGAARGLGAKLASFAGMAEVLFAIAYAWLLLHQIPSALQFGGGVLIFAGVALVRLDELRGGPAPVSPSPAGQAPAQPVATVR